MDIMILGGSGQLGKTIYRELKNDFEVICLSKSEASITNESEIKKAVCKNKPKFIINCAAYTKVELAEIEKKKVNSVNYEGVRNLTEAAKLNDACLIHFSTDYVFDGEKKSPYLETDKTNPINEYGSSKLRGETHIVNNIENFFIFRVSGIFSKYGENFVKSMIRLKDKEQLAIVSDQIMKPSSAKFIAHFLKNNLLNNNFVLLNAGLYNLPSPGPQISWQEFAEIIFKEMHKQKLIKKIPKIIPILSKDYKSLVLRPKFSVLSNSKVKKKFILDKINFKESLKIELKSIYQSL
jgi:dTDP-4-dehydrorhamnose reductase